MRKGMMLGTGQGYRNYKPMMAYDKRVHAQSAMGIKQPQRVPAYCNYGGKRIITTKTEVYKFDELPEEAKQKALERYYDINVDGEYWSDYDGKMGFSTEEMKKAGIKGDVFSGDNRCYFDIDRGAYIQFPELKVANEENFRKWLKIPKSLWAKVNPDYSFKNERDSDTRLEFGESYALPPKEQKLLRDAEEIFSDKVHQALSDLKKEYEYKTSDEGIKEAFEANDYEFTKDGKIF